MNIKNESRLAGVIEVSSGTGPNGLSWKSFRASSLGFCRAPVLLTGPTEAVLIDAGFTLADGEIIAAEIAESGKRLTTILITAEDPDYYFSLGPIVATNPGVRVIAPPRIAANIAAGAQKKLDIWSPQMVGLSPNTMDELVLPTSFDGDSITVDGELIEVVTASKIGNRKYVWVPSLEAIFGGILVHSGVHVWVADTKKLQSQKGWIDELNMMIARNPKIVIAAHAAKDAPTGVDALIFSRDYLIKLHEELEKAKSASELYAAMLIHYPDIGIRIALDIGSKVLMGEMDWD